MSYEIVYVEGVEDEFAQVNLSLARIIAIKDKLKLIGNHSNPQILTDRVLNTPLRKIPFGNYRIFLYINKKVEVIYILSIKHHNKCYKRKELNKVLSILNRLSE